MNTVLTQPGGQDRGDQLVLVLTAGEGLELVDQHIVEAIGCDPVSGLHVGHGPPVTPLAGQISLRFCRGGG